MKRFMFACMTALTLVALAEQKASAWCSFNFSTGLNTSFSCGGCRLFWGLFETSPGPNVPFGPACWGKGQQQQCQPWAPHCPPEAGCFMPPPMMGAPMAPSAECAMPYADGSVKSGSVAQNNGIQHIGYTPQTNGLFYSTGYSPYQPLFGYDAYNYAVPGYWYNH